MRVWALTRWYDGMKEVPSKNGWYQVTTRADVKDPYPVMMWWEKDHWQGFQNAAPDDKLCSSPQRVKWRGVQRVVSQGEMGVTGKVGEVGKLEDLERWSDDSPYDGYVGYGWS